MSFEKIDVELFKQCKEIYNKVPKEFFEENCLYNAMMKEDFELVHKMIDSGLFEDEYEIAVYDYKYNNKKIYILDYCIYNKLEEIAYKLIISGKGKLTWLDNENYLSVAFDGGCDNLFKKLLKLEPNISGLNKMGSCNNMLFNLINGEYMELLKEFVKYADVQAYYEHIIENKMYIYSIKLFSLIHNCDIDLLKKFVNVNYMTIDIDRKNFIQEETSEQHDKNKQSLNEIKEILKPYVKQLRIEDDIEALRKENEELKKQVITQKEREILKSIISKLCDTKPSENVVKKNFPPKKIISELKTEIKKEVKEEVKEPEEPEENFDWIEDLYNQLYGTTQQKP